MTAPNGSYPDSDGLLIYELSAGATADKPALGVLGSLPSGESDPLVTTDSTGAGSVAQASWQPIETAPSKQTVILSRLGETLCVTAYRFGPVAGWRHAHSSDAICFEPTHWMPLPEPPCALSSTDRATLPGHDETMANLDALTISSPANREATAMTAPNGSYPASATEALIAKWRAEAKRHEAAAEEPNMDAQEYTLHDESHRVYSKCADELATIGVAQPIPTASVDGEAIIKEAAREAVWGRVEVGRQRAGLLANRVYRSEGDLWTDSPINLSKFVRNLAILTRDERELSAGATADKPALGVLGSLPSGESDPLVTTDSTGAGSVAQGAPERRIAQRLADVVMMLDAPDAYNRGYIAAVCRSILSSLSSTTRATIPGHVETMANLDALTISSTEGK
jgi:hypothetical protein